MQKVDSIKVLKAIRDFEILRGLLPEKRVKIIMISALDDAEYVHKAFELGCEGYVAKPIDIDKLINIMKGLEIIKIA